MEKYFWVAVKFQDGHTKWYCVPGRVGWQCFRPSFSFKASGQSDEEELRALTDRVNAVIEEFIAAHPDRTLRILEVEEGDEDGQLAFAFVETDLEISIPGSE
jgi:hypothetical protein